MRPEDSYPRQTRIQKRCNVCLMQCSWNPVPRLTAEHISVKTGSFGGIDDQYFMCGSDDFRAYGWNIPPEAEMRTETEMNSEIGENDIGTIPSGRLQILFYA